VAIATVLSGLDKLPAFYYFGILAQLSLSLAFFNLLPVPVLDGGHMLLLTVEVLRRRRLEPDTQRAVAMVGLVLIGVLFVFIMWKDIVKHIL
jgi:regulator of sigma E protease